jgi:tetratricopeptide (TPR) repeat protein
MMARRRIGQTGSEKFEKTIAVFPLTLSSRIRSMIQASQLHNVDPDKALAACDEAVELDPTNAVVHFAHGCAFVELERFDEAIAAFDRAIELNPVFVDAQTLRGAAFVLLERFDEAFVGYDRAIKLDPRDALPHGLRGWALFGLGRFEDALKAFDHAIELGPTDASRHRNRSEVLLDPDRLEVAFNMSLDGRGQALLALGRYDEALAHFDRVVEFNPTTAEGYEGRGQVLMELGRYDEALANFDRAVEFDSTSVLTALRHGQRVTALRHANAGWPSRSCAASRRRSRHTIELSNSIVQYRTHTVIAGWRWWGLAVSRKRSRRSTTTSSSIQPRPDTATVVGH